MNTLQIRLLGDFSVQMGQEPVTTLNKPRLQSLLAYLILHHESAQFRYHLANIFWPESAETQAYTNLRNQVHLLRRALPDGERLILSTNQTLQFNPEVPVKVDVFEFQRYLGGNLQAAPLEDLEATSRLYRGDLLYHCYDEWISAERAELRRNYLNLLSELIERYENLRRYPEAIACAERLIEMEPLLKDGYLRLMRLLAILGDTPLALKTYRDYARQLKRELGLEPEADIRELYSRLSHPGKKSPAPAEPMQDAIPLVGRAAEWQAIQSLWKTALNGNPSLLILSGEAGIGKTRLGEELVHWAAQQGMRTATARCYSSEGSLPYAPVVTWLRRVGLPPLEKVWQTELSRLLPELLPNQRERLAPLTEAWQRMRLFEALARALLGKKEKTLLLVDDLQWGDQDTLEWLHYLLRYDPAAPLLVVGSVRSEEAPANPAYARLADILQQEGRYREVELGPLNELETRLLADHVAGKPLGGGIGALLFQETEGNPLFIVETVRIELYKDALPGVQPLPFKVRAVLENRIRQLSPPTREIAVMAATIGRDFSLDLLRQAGGFPEADLVKGIDDLLRRRIVREIDFDTFLFSHEKLHQAVLVDIGSPHRRLLHRKVAEALLQDSKKDAGTRYGEIAGHYQQAGNDAEAVQHYLLAAKKARDIYANERAILYYERALALCEAKTGETSTPLLTHAALASLYEELGEMMALAGKYPQAQAFFEQALGQPFTQTRLWRAQVYRKISGALVQQFKHPQAHDALVLAEQSLHLENEPGTLLDKQEWIQIHLARSDLYYWGNVPDQMEAIIQKIRPVVDTDGRPDQRIELLSQQYMARLRRERYRLSDETVQIVRRRLELTSNLDNPYDTGWAQFMLGFGLLWHGEPAVAREWLTKSYDAALRMGARLLQVRSLAYLSVISRMTEDMAILGEYTDQLLELASAIGETTYEGIALANQGWTAWRDGDLIRAEQLCTSANETWDKTRGNMFHWLANWVLLAIAVSRGDLSQAKRHALALLDPNSLYQPVEEPAAIKLREALSACQLQDSRAARLLFDQALELARSFHDL